MWLAGSETVRDPEVPPLAAGRIESAYASQSALRIASGTIGLAFRLTYTGDTREGAPVRPLVLSCPDRYRVRTMGLCNS